MTWLPIAISASAITAVVSILDSHLITKRFPSLAAFLAPVAILHCLVGLVVFAINPLPEGTGAGAIAIAFASGIVRVIAALIMLRTMRSEEVSRVIPVANTFPIFVAVLAVPVLGETLGWLEWIAILVTVSGAVLISTQWDSESKGIRLRRSFITLMISSVLFGVANTGTKYALDYMSFWSMYGINSICLGAIFAIYSLRPSVLTEITGMEQRSKALGLVAFNEIIAIAGFVMSFWAMKQGPVSLVSTIMGIRPAFVFLFALALSFFFPAVLNERFSWRVILVRIVSISLVIGGVTLLTLGG